MRNRAVFTIVQNEPVFLPIWLAYYGRFFVASDTYVLDHDSTDGSTTSAQSSSNVLGIHREKSFDHDWLRSTVTSFQHFLLNSYENVLFTEVDEFVVADPTRYSGLDDYIERFDRDAVRCTGFNVVHYPEEEAPLAFDKPILDQRKYWHGSENFSKSLLSKVPLSWGRGFHKNRVHVELEPDPELLLIHLHRVDYDYCLDRHRANAAMDWNEADLKAGHGAQNRLVHPRKFKKWFFRGADDADRELIPERFKSAL
jgi:hypothetical protein